MSELVFLIQSPKRTARLNLSGPFFVIGRGEPFPVFHDDPTLSREHAVIVRTAEGFCLKDLGSRNGVQLNGRRLGRYAEQPLGAGDTVELGNTRILAREKAEVEAAIAAGEPIVVDPQGRTGLEDTIAPITEDPELTGEGTLEMEPGELSQDGILALEKTELAVDEPELGLAADGGEIGIPEGPAAELEDLAATAAAPPSGEVADARDLPTLRDLPFEEDEEEPLLE